MSVKPPDGHSVDAFHRGAFHIVQPKRGAYRAGMDAMVLAAALPQDFAGVFADFGAGAGAASLAVLSRCPRARAVLIERTADMAECARLSLDHEANLNLAGRATIIEFAIGTGSVQRREAGIADNSFDFVIMNPPFNAVADRPPPDALKAGAHVMTENLFEDWIRVAASVLKPGGGLAAIFRPESLLDALNACQRRFGNVHIKPLLPQIDKKANRLVLSAVKGSRAPLSMLPPLIMHDEAGGGVSADADAVINGLSSLFD